MTHTNSKHRCNMKKHKPTLTHTHTHIHMHIKTNNTSARQSNQTRSIQTNMLEGVGEREEESAAGEQQLACLTTCGGCALRGQRRENRKACQQLRPRHNMKKTILWHRPTPNTDATWTNYNKNSSNWWHNTTETHTYWIHQASAQGMWDPKGHPNTNPIHLYESYRWRPVLWLFHPLFSRHDKRHNKMVYCDVQCCGCFSRFGGDTIYVIIKRFIVTSSAVVVSPAFCEAR